LPEPQSRAVPPRRRIVVEEPALRHGRQQCERAALGVTESRRDIREGHPLGELGQQLEDLEYALGRLHPLAHDVAPLIPEILSTLQTSLLPGDEVLRQEREQEQERHARDHVSREQWTPVRLIATLEERQ